MSITPGQQKIIQDFCFSEPKTVSQIAERLKLTGKKGLMSLYNFLKTNIAKTLFYIEKLDGFKLVRTNPLNFLNKTSAISGKSEKRLDLIMSKQNSPQTKKHNGRTYKKLDGLKRACPERLEAILKLNRINKFGFYNKTDNEFLYTNTIKIELDELFTSYINRIQNEKIIMSLAPDGSPLLAQDIILPYKTRFTSSSRKKQITEGFEAVYQKASSKHLKGVFLTLTSQPGGSLWEINKRTQKAWGLFSKFLNRALPARGEWVKVAEFQQNGMIHFHVLILGVNWLQHKSVISYAWKHYGGGSIIDIHSIRNDPVYGWQWARSCPLEAAGVPLKDYLSRYLQKSMSPLSGSLYWAMGVRYWTCSKSLLPKREKPQANNPKKYFLKGVLSYIRGFRPSRRKDSIELFSNPQEEKIKDPGGSLTFSRAATLAYIKGNR